MAPLPVLFDLQGSQSVDHRDRGVARYVVELARHLEASAPERVAAYLLNPDLALPGGIEPLVASGKLRFVDDPGVYRDGSILHLTSPFELSIGIDRLLPPAARAADLRLVVTLFDLIPAAMPEVYLEDAGLRRRYRARQELVRGADLVLAISDHTASEAGRLLGIAPERVRTIPLAPSAGFRPAASRDDAVAEARAAVPGLRDRYVLYTGGSDGRKNLEGLLEGWAAVPAAVRTSRQLVVAGYLPPLRRNHLEVMAARLGIGDEFLPTGFVGEDVLVALNQGAELFVFPSLAEGYGLPAVEAMACHTPTIVADNTSLVELLPEEARFDGADAAATAAAITRALTDDVHRRHLGDLARRPIRTWSEAAADTDAAYRSLDSACRHRVAAGPPPSRGAGRRTHPFRLAVVSPLPPQPGGVADYSFRLLEALRAEGPVDAYVDGPPHHREAIVQAQVPEGVRARPLAALERVEALGGRYDGVVYCLGNSEFHTGTLAALHRRPGVVLAHEVRLTNLYRFAQWQHPATTPGGFHATLQRMYEGRLPDSLGSSGDLDAAEADRWGILMARDAVAASTRFATTSAFAATLARLDARPEHRHRVVHVPFGLPPPTTDGRGEGRSPAAGPVTIASFGVVNRLKRGPLLVEAFAAGVAARPDARLVFVGPAGAEDTAAIRDRAEGLGVGRRVEVVGAVPPEDYRTWLARTTVAVQLRGATNGEHSAAIGDCLAAGVPTVVTGIGANRDLPTSAVVPVPAEVTGVELGAVLARLVADAGERASRSAAAIEHARRHSFAAAAEALYELVSSAD